MRTCLALTAMLAVATTLTAHAQHPSFAGAWRLNVAQSFMGNDHPFPDYQLTKTIAQTGDNLSITDASIHNSVVNIPLPDAKTTTLITADGKEREVQAPAAFPGAPPSRAQVTAAWQGDNLQIVQLTNGLATWGKQRLFLSDAAHLIVLVEQHSIYGDTEQRLVFDKQ